ncbi:hypothetical protein MKW94_014195 [Papaver nudicaule]|uniref:WAT1-related protein n=1 Tax=Papaver nudicaule TaxID=74823 RepID=A0AA41V416_PAPNU|nr:hypothetical protein [Papaver nudicaule]
MELLQRVQIVVQGSGPLLGMLAAQMILTGMTVTYKLAISEGMDLKILTAYRCIFASIFIVPVAFFKERGSRPPITWKILLQSFICGLLGFSLSQNLYGVGINLASATFPAAMTNLIPAFTFVMAALFGIEKLEYKSLDAKLKLGGMLLGVGGAMLLCFYKGVQIPMWSSNVLHLKHHEHVRGREVLGMILSFGSCLSYSAWLIMQTKLTHSYPCYYSSTALTVSMASIQSVVFALCTTRDWSEWKLSWNVRLFSVVYSGVVASGVMMTLIAWCVKVRGPLFASVFSPVGLVLVAFTGSILLNEKLHVGFVIGGVLIAIGLYLVLWGKSKEMRRMSRLMSVANSTDSEPENVRSTSTTNNASNITAAEITEVECKNDTIIDVAEIQQVNK